MSKPWLINEPCPKCSKGEITRPGLYIHECNICEFKYRVNPAAKHKFIEILKKSILENKK